MIKINKLNTLVPSLLAFLSLTASVQLQAETFASGDQRVSVVELYTSEGCSSCPPADRWLSKLTSSDELFKTVIPVAFHVDYWNYLGWRDEFSDVRFSERQRLYNRIGQTGSVYTPGFVINGEEWRGFFSPLHRNSPPIETKENVGELTLTGQGDVYALSFDSPDAKRNSRNLTVNLVYLGTGLSTEIKRGENAGRKLEHDFVVLGMASEKLDDEGRAELPRVEIKDATAVAAWVSEQGNPTPIQAVGGWLDTPATE